MDKNLGRGGRGALLLNALSSVQRRPGEKITEKTPKEEVKAITPSLGRAALLSHLCSKSNDTRIGNCDHQVPKQNHEIKPDVRPMGRGNILKSFIKENETSELPSISSLKISENEPVVMKGRSGSIISVSTNHIRLKRISNTDLYEYHVDFIPQIESRNIRFKLLNQLLDIIGKIRVFDGSKLYLPIKLNQNVINLSAVRPTDNSDIKVKIKFIGIGNSTSKVHLFNVLFKKAMHHLKLARIGRNDFDPKGAICIPQHKLEVWPGYVTSVSENEGGLMLNCDASFRVLRKVSCFDVLAECVRKNSKAYMNEAFKLLVGSIVLTRYNNKTYCIDDIAWDMNPMSTFEQKGTKISFYDYYRKSYGIEIIDQDQPILINRPKKQEKGQSQLICLIPELCFLTGLTDELRNDFKVMKDIAHHTRISPAERQRCLLKFRNNIMKNEDARNIFSEWGLALDNENIQLDGRQLPVEKICFKKATLNIEPSANWNNLLNNEVCTAVDLQNWVLIFTQRNKNQVMNFIRTLQQVSQKFGMMINHPKLQELKNDSPDNYVRCLRDNINPNLQMAVMIFPTSRDDRYCAVKKICCVDHPIPSQVIISKTLGNPTRLTSVCQKIALQMNCKLGGELWHLKIPLKGVMVCGVDVYHDAQNRGRSVCGFTASMNSTITRWFSNVYFQNPGEELINGFSPFIMAACRKYYDVNHQLPKYIMVFRDGVGDGQLSHVSDYEVPQLLESLKGFGIEYVPLITYVVVQKRINTRIFLNTGRTVGNPLPGTIVDHTITRRNWYDFFLVSQHVGQGTVTPTHYIVVHDSSNLAPDRVQRLTYKFTHLYYNWPGTIRSPAPCQYAHRLAYLVGQNIRKAPAKELSDRLYFL